MRRIWFAAAAAVLLVVVVAVGFPSQSAQRSLQILYRQCTRWAAAAAQDASPIIGVLHANYATGYLWAIQDIATPESFHAATGADFHELAAKIVGIQDAATRRLVALCPAAISEVEPVLLKGMYANPDNYRNIN